MAEERLAQQSRTTMQPAPNSQSVPLSRAAWQSLLARCVGEPQMEPLVRRRARRYAVNLGACRALYQGDRKPVELHVKLLNASQSGVMVMSRAKVPANIPVLLAFTPDIGEEYLLAGEIVHCTDTIGGYKVGIRLRFPVLPEDPP
jgi:hypothetical protein